jgi:hypothetical protein
VVWTEGRLNEIAEALRRSVRNQTYHVAKAIRDDDRMPASREICRQAKLAVEMIDVFLVCLFARVMKTEASYSLGPLTWVFRLELPLW